MKKTMMGLAALAAGAAIACPLFGPDCRECFGRREPLPTHRMAPHFGPRRAMPPRPWRPHPPFDVCVQTNVVKLYVFAPPLKPGETQAVWKVEQTTGLGGTNEWTTLESEVAGDKAFFRVVRIYD